MHSFLQNHFKINWKLPIGKWTWETQSLDYLVAQRHNPRFSARFCCSFHFSQFLLHRWKRKINKRTEWKWKGIIRSCEKVPVHYFGIEIDCDWLIYCRSYWNAIKSSYFMNLINRDVCCFYVKVVWLLHILS